MIKTRQGVFETNSSSQHSITVSNNRDLVKPEGEGPIVLTGGQFGWEVVDYYDFLTKANYVAQDQEHSSRNLALLQRVISEFTGRVVNIELVGHPEKGYNVDAGYIDHQSQGTTGKLFPSDEDLKYHGDGPVDEKWHALWDLRQFLFSPHSELHTDNDNG